MQVTVPFCAAIVVALLDIFVGARYCVKLIRRHTAPRLATWIIFELGVGMSLATYFTTQDHSVLKAVLNVTDAAVVSLILLSFFAVRRSAKIHFTTNERLCLAISGLTLTAWTITRSGFVGFVGFQVVMTVAYFPTLENLWRSRPGPAPESAETWSINAVAALIGVVVDFTGSHRDFVAMLYPLRAFTLCAIVVVLVQRWKYKARSRLKTG